jgi:aminoglycoside phosphotransferase (APT) family kinase protein
MSARETLDFQASFTGTQEVREPHRFDVGQLEKYLDTALPGFRGPLEVREFKGGQSNPTYHLSTPGARYVLRRKPPGKLLRSAHAVDREFRVISALNRVDFPVPRAHLLCEDESVIGTAFYVMECVEGRVLWDQLMRDLSADERRSIFESKIQILAWLHTTDYEALGLSDFGRPGNYFARQISRWTKQYVASETEEIPEMNRLIEWLPANLPEDETCTIIHGDYKLDNMVVHPTEPRVIAILDWELSTLGNPLGDLTYHLSHRHAPRSVFEDLSDADYATLGIPTDAEWVERYCELTGREAIRNLDYYLAYNIFRSAGILQGIVGRVRDGTAASAHAASMASGVRPLAVRAMDYARKLGA